MRVGIVTDSPIKTALGYSIRPKELAINLAKLGCEVHIFSAVDKGFNISNNVLVHGISAPQAFLADRAYRFARKTFKSSLTAKYLYRKVTLQTLSNRLANSLCSEVKKQNIDILQGEKEIAGMASVSIGKRLGIPAVIDVHGLLAEEAVQYQFIKNNSREFLESRGFVAKALNQADATIVVTEGLKNHFIQIFDMDARHIFVVPNATGIRNVTRQPRNRTCNVMYAGIFEPWERVDLAISSIPHVLKGHNSAKFLFAGSGSLKPVLLKQADEMKVKNNANFVGQIPYEKIADFLVRGDVAVLPSSIDIVRKVACPIKLFDYLGAGLPVVTVKELWWSSFVEENGVGLATEPDPESFGCAIRDLLGDPERINAMSEKAIKLVREKYNWSQMAKMLLQVYEKLL
jgi:glycosyltransferase involved in cell wall biosynthesis